MDKLKSDFSITRFFETLKNASQSLLLLDYDGTLSPFTQDRDKAVPYEGVVPQLNSIISSGRTRLIIISGRSIASLRRLIGNDFQCELWGSHGLERQLPGNNPVTRESDQKVSIGLSEIDEWSEKNNLRLYLETKLGGRAFHWRGLPDQDIKRIKNLVEDKWSDLLDQFGLVMHRFDGGLEIRVKSVSKANAVTTILRESKEGAVIAYLGDDLTDEDAFHAIGDRGMKVLVRTESRPTLADIRIEPPEELLDFLSRWRDAVLA